MEQFRDKVLEFALEVGLHLEQLEPQHLRVDRDRIIASAGSLRLVDKLVGLRRLLGDGVDGMFEDFAFAAGHIQMLGDTSDGHDATGRELRGRAGNR